MRLSPKATIEIGFACTENVVKKTKLNIPSEVIVFKRESSFNFIVQYLSESVMIIIKLVSLI